MDDFDKAFRSTRRIIFITVAARVAVEILLVSAAAALIWAITLGVS